MAEKRKAVKKPQGKKPALKKVKKTEGSRLPVPVSRPVEKELVTTSDKTFHVVAIGASAGGLEAYEKFFAGMPEDSGMAFVLIPHLDPKHKSILGDLLKRYTRMKVFEAEENMPVRPNCIYVIPPNKDMAIKDAKLQLREPEITRGIRHPIDFFFRSLAEDFKEKAICIVLSGTGSEGALGLKAIKGEGGLVMAQDDPSYDGMPQSAIATGLVDYILPASKMPQQLIVYGRRQYIRPARPHKIEEKSDSLQKILSLVRAQTGHDFSQYKENTLIRRVERRMAVHQIETINNYVHFLRTNPAEIDVLFRELLIRVTNFFRDSEAFNAIKKEAFPLIFRGKPADYMVRIWVPGCSTGEEAYSLAMLAREYMEKTKRKYKVQVFATDIDTAAIETARAGLYPESITVDVSPQRLDRFFILKGGMYKVRNEIREMVVFAVQNLIKDPPFSKLDMISCRNLLIYLGPELQKKVIPLFNYALNPGGILFLGSSETIGTFAEMYKMLDKKWKLFQSRRIEQGPVHMPIEMRPLRTIQGASELRSEMPRPTEVSIRDMLEPMLLHLYSPPAAVVTENGDILYIHGRTGQYLEPATGKASLNILEMAREGLKFDLRAAFRKAVKLKKDVTADGLEVRSNGGFIRIRLEIKPIRKPENFEGLIAVIFHELLPAREARPVEIREAGHAKLKERCEDLQIELKSSKERLQTTIEELETSNEELKSANEELQSANEELQSTNEELETSREELQSVNEELVTVNTELQTKVDELAHINSDMTNLLASTQIATMFLDRELKIKRFTPSAVNVINIIDSDVGRPLSDIVTKLEYPELVKDAAEVLLTLIPREMIVRQKNGLWFLTRVMPYRTLENLIDGVVITFTDITELKKAREELEDALEYAQCVTDTAPEPLMYVNGALKVIRANKAYFELFQTSPENVENKNFFELDRGLWKSSLLKEKLDRLVSRGTTFRDLKVEYGAGPSKKTLFVSAKRLIKKNGKVKTMLLSIEPAEKRG